MKLELSRLIDALRGPVWTALADGRAGFVNQRWCEYTGLGLDQAIGYEWQSAIHPEDLASALERWHSLLESGQQGEIEARLRRHDGEYRRFVISITPIADETGHVIRWCCVTTDIEKWLQAGEAVRADAALEAAEAELRQAHVHLTEAQRLSKTGSFTSDLLRDEHVWSDEFYRICEFEPGTPITIQRLQDIVVPEDVPVFQGAIERGIAGIDPDFVFRIVTAAGALKYLRGVAHRIEHIADRPVFVGAVQDVTETKLAEHALNKARAELAHVARVTTLSALTASIAHEVNQPLSGIITNASTCLRMLSGDPPNLDGARATALRTLRDGNRASEVIQHLRSLFANKQPKTEAVDLNDAARELLALSTTELQQNRVILGIDFDEGLPVVAGDRVQLQQVILNLILNAADSMKAIDDRPRDLLVATAREDAGSVRLSVRDSGVGIDASNIEKLFGAFYTTKAHGMGVGLSISRSIIESHAGRLWASANEGPGATFSFSIPCR